MEPAWLAVARAELGVRELPGTPDNPRIIKYWNDAKLASVADGQDEVPWCAAFVGAMLARSQIPHSGKANARSYEAWGRKLNSPVLGCVVVFSRPPHAWQGLPWIQRAGWSRSGVGWEPIGRGVDRVVSHGSRGGVAMAFVTAHQTRVGRANHIRRYGADVRKRGVESE